MRNISSVTNEDTPVSTPALPDYSAAYSKLGGQPVVDAAVQGWRGTGLDENTIAGFLSPYTGQAQAGAGASLSPDWATRAGGNTLSGNILMGDSYMASNPTLANALKNLTGNSSQNVAVGGQSSDQTLNYLNNFLNSGGTFGQGSTAMLNTGVNDFLNTNLTREQTQSNIDQILKLLGKQGVNVVLSGAPNVSNYEDLYKREGEGSLAMDPLYSQLASSNPNVRVTDAMSQVLNNPDYRYADNIHPGIGQGYDTYNQALIDAMNSFKPAANVGQQGGLTQAAFKADPSVFSMTPDQKADYYNSQIGNGVSDETLRRSYGGYANDDPDWQYLRTLAQTRGSR